MVFVAEVNGVGVDSCDVIAADVIEILHAISNATKRGETEFKIEDAKVIVKQEAEANLVKQHFCDRIVALVVKS